MNLIKNKVRVKRNMQLLAPYNTEHSSCSVANACSPPQARGRQPAVRLLKHFSLPAKQLTTIAYRTQKNKQLPGNAHCTKTEI